MIRTAMFVGVAALIAGCALVGPRADAAPIASTSQAESACRASGLNPSEVPFTYCTQSLTASASRQLFAMYPATQMSDAAHDGGIEMGEQAERACVANGLNPATEGYSACVGNLRATIDQSDNVGAR